MIGALRSPGKTVANPGNSNVRDADWRRLPRQVPKLGIRQLSSGPRHVPAQMNEISGLHPSGLALWRN
jgi:hypothetical protein